MSSDAASQTRLLLCSRERDAVMASQAEVFRGSGRAVTTAASSEEARQHIENTDFDIIILNHTLPFAERKALARGSKMRRPATGVLVLHHSGSLGNPYVDLAVDSRIGVSAMLQTLQRVEAMLHARTHHADGEGIYVVVADVHRNYTYASDAVCELLGYDRALLLQMRIDDVVVGSTAVTAPLFQEFVAKGAQAGKIALRHRSGKLISVNYCSRAEPDGCMIARLEPVEAAAAD